MTITAGVVGVILVVVGVALWSIPAALVVAGLLLLAVAVLLYEPRRAS